MNIKKCKLTPILQSSCFYTRGSKNSIRTFEDIWTHLMFTFQAINPNSIPEREALLQMLRGFQMTQCIYVAAKLNIPERLENGPKHSDDLAQETHTDKDFLYRTLRALSSLGVLKEVEPKYFENTALTPYLKEHQKGSIRSFLLTEVEDCYACWEKLLDCLYTGKIPFDTVHGVDFEEYCQKNTQQSELYNRAMTDINAVQILPLLSAYDFSLFSKIMDVGGGQGGFLAAILNRYPTIKGVLFERDYNISQAEKLLTDEKVIDRCELVSGNFFESVPAGGDLYILKKIILNWNDEKDLQILKNCYQAMQNSNAKLLIIDRILNPGRWRDNLADLNLGLLSYGKIRSESEYKELLQKAGFQVTNIIPTKSLDSLIEAIIPQINP